jgi:hypothetical protein
MVSSGIAAWNVWNWPKADGLLLRPKCKKAAIQKAVRFFDQAAQIRGLGQDAYSRGGHEKERVH